MFHNCFPFSIDIYRILLINTVVSSSRYLTVKLSWKNLLSSLLDTQKMSPVTYLPVGLYTLLSTLTISTRMCCRNFILQHKMTTSSKPFSLFFFIKCIIFYSLLQTLNLENHHLSEFIFGLETKWFFLLKFLHFVLFTHHH